MQIKELTDMVIPFKNKLYRFALSIVGNSFDAEDIVQEVMIKIWKKKDHFQAIENKEAWCMTVTRNLSIDKTRSKKHKTQDINDYYHISDSGATPDASLESKDALKYVKIYMDQLPEKQKEVIHLRDVEGFTYQEISDITGITVDQVKVYLHRGRKKLREKLLKLDI